VVRLAFLIQVQWVSADCVVLCDRTVVRTEWSLTPVDYITSFNKKPTKNDYVMEICGLAGFFLIDKVQSVSGDCVVLSGLSVVKTDWSLTPVDYISGERLPEVDGL
jgi:hypothetical protein